MPTAGERVELTCAVPWIADILTEGAAGQLTAADGTTPDVRVTVERGSAAFDVTGWRVLTRGAWCRQGQVVISDACSSGLDLQVTAGEPSLDVVARWRPLAGNGPRRPCCAPGPGCCCGPSCCSTRRCGGASSAAGSAARLRLPTRPRRGSGAGRCCWPGPGGSASRRWCTASCSRGRVQPATTCASATGRTRGAWSSHCGCPPGDGGQGAGCPTAAGRRRGHDGRRLSPDRLVVLGAVANQRRPPRSQPQAARSLVAGTYMAGELRRYWAFAATLALGTGLGASHPPVAAIAESL